MHSKLAEQLHLLHTRNVMKLSVWISREIDLSIWQLSKPKFIRKSEFAYIYFGIHPSDYDRSEIQG